MYIGKESMSSLSQKIQELVPSGINNVNLLGICKTNTNLWATEKCPDFAKSMF